MVGFAWQAGATSGCYLAGTVIQGLVVLNHPDPNYVPQRWHGSLIAIAMVFISAFINTVLSPKLPFIGIIIGLLHIFGFIAVIVPLWVLAPLSKPHDVFTNFNNGGNWGSVGLNALVGYPKSICFSHRS